MNFEPNLLGKMLFTAEDDGITGRSMRDPLGLQPIWSYYGRKVIKHLTTVSTDMRGFREVLLCLSICGNCIYILNDKKYNEEKFKIEKFSDLILLFEQLFIYSAIDNDDTDGILGADNGKMRFNSENGNPFIKCDKTILVREIFLGYYGRYKTPLYSMGIIDANGNVSSDIDVPNLIGDKEYNEILTAFKSFVGLRDDKKYKKFKASKLLYSAVCGKIKKKEKQFWLERLNINGDNKDELMCECYKKVGSSDNTKVIFNNLNQISKVTNVEKLEPFLICLEKVFYKTLNLRNIKDIKIDRKELSEYKIRFKDFITISDDKNTGSDVIDSRINFIKNELNPENDQFINKIYYYHKLVCEQKNSSVWLEIDSLGNIQSYTKPDMEISNINIWERNYYIDSLRSIRNGLESI